MTYDDVTEIKAMLEHIVVLLQQIASASLRIEDDVADIASALTPDEGEPFDRLRSKPPP